MAKQMRPYSLDTRKSSQASLSEVDLAQWKEVILAQIRAEPDWVPFIITEWKNYKTANRGKSEKALFK